LLKYKFLILCKLLLFAHAIQSQSEFNKLIDFGLWQHNGYALFQSDSFIYISGQALDTTNLFFERDPFFIKLDNKGLLIDSILVRDDDEVTAFANLARNMIVIDNFIYRLVADFEKAYLCRTDLELNNTEIVHMYKDTINNLSAPEAVGMIEYPPGKITLANLTILNNDFRGLIKQYTPGTSQVEEFYIDFPSSDFFLRNILKNSNEEIIIIGHVGNPGIFLMRLDSNFEVVESKVFEEHRWGGPLMETIQDHNNDYVFVTVESIIAGGSPRFRPTISKINADWELEWHTTVGITEFESDDVWLSLVESHNEDGYVTCGFEQTNDDSLSYVGIVAKVGLDGDSIWFRKFSPVGNIPRQGELWDIIKSNDGNYLAVGWQAPNLVADADSSLTKTWLIKFDEDGHLLPDPSVSVVSPEFSKNIKVFPNPTQGYINIEHDYVDNVHYYLYDQQGRLVIKKENTQAFHTYFLSLEGLESGIYFLNIISSEGIKHVEKLIISN